MKKKYFRINYTALLVFLISLNIIHSKDNSLVESNNWGYSYGDLLVQLDEWNASPWVTIDSIGASVQNRTLWELTLTDTIQSDDPKQTVYMHVRTHPNEIQSFWVANEFINQLLLDDPFSQEMRKKCTFYIVPMYNPDGVELGYPRQNANEIDIESNWSTEPMEPEPTALKQRFIDLMNSDQPIRIALNMHAAYNGNPRYFVYHHENGTSVEYSQLEQEFIGGVGSYYSTGIGPWDTFVSWTSGTPSQYPESWFWSNHGADVMALTYEDWNSDDAGNYDSTANALLHGINEYLMNHNISTILEESQFPKAFSLKTNYPNPFNSTTTIRYALYEKSMVSLSIFNSNGQLIETLVNANQGIGEYLIQWNSAQVPSGIYLYQLNTSTSTETRKMTILK
ncbi:MAG: T9SS type A sorting domain-containing protein [Candidatus Marinimicrobia bacterium]|nr:T9SS type A sorting domain-containing protein [Candidatus Neomarinimicrobiota bacterium]